MQGSGRGKELQRILQDMALLLRLPNHSAQGRALNIPNFQLDFKLRWFVKHPTSPWLRSGCCLSEHTWQLNFYGRGGKFHILKGNKKEGEKKGKKKSSSSLGLVLFKTWQLFESCLQIQNVWSWYWELQPGVNRKGGMDLTTADVAVRAEGELRALARM